MQKLNSVKSLDIIKEHNVINSSKENITLESLW